MELGRLTLVDIRDVWKSESSDFTPWLAKKENLTLLADTLHLGELTLSATEHDVGDFSADLIATDESGAQVLIENQLEQTDHRHLGQVLTYLAGLDGDAKIIWIATKFRDEHRAAIDWLNANTISNFDFFGVEIEVYRIGVSTSAPRFSVVAKPNDWTRTTKEKVRRISNDEQTESQVFYQNYWLELKSVFEESGETNKFPKPWARIWLPFGMGRTGFEICVYLMRNESKIRIELYMHQNKMPPKQAFNLLLSQKAEIEKDAGKSLDWQKLSDKQASRIATYSENVDFENKEDWKRQHKWIIEELILFRKVFTGRVKALQINAPLKDLNQQDEPD